MSKIDIVKQTTPAIALMNAISKQFPRDDIREKLNLPEGSEVEVKLTVNGVEIGFEQLVEDLWQQLNDDVNARALRLAKKSISGAGFDDLFLAMQNAEWAIGDALQKALERI